MLKLAIHECTNGTQQVQHVKGDLWISRHSQAVLLQDLKTVLITIIVFFLLLFGAKHWAFLHDSMGLADTHKTILVFLEHSAVPRYYVSMMQHTPIPSMFI